MDTKTFLRDPGQAITDLGLEQKGPAARELLEKAEDLKAVRGKLKQLKKDKSAVAREFKTVEAGTTEHTALVERMQTVSDSYKSVEQSVKDLEKHLRESLSVLQATESKKPPFFEIPRDGRHSGHIAVRELGADEMVLWQEYMARQVNAPAYCQAPWPDIIQSAFSNPTRVWVAVSDRGELLGGIPLTFFDSRLFGRFAVSIPYFSYGAVLTPYFNVLQALLAHLKGVCESEQLSYIEIRTMQPDLGLPFVSKKVSMVLRLPETERQLDDQLGTKVRAQCKKTEPFGPEIRFGRLALLDDFYWVFAINMRDLGTPVYSKRWFREILSHPEVTATIAVVYVRGKPVSTGFLVGHNGMLEIPWASTVKSANAMDTNMWMYRKILDFAIREGYDFFDFGRSTRDAGTYRFKKQWGAQPYEHYWYYVLPEGSAVPGLNPDNPKYRMMINIWKRLPVWVTKLIGPPVVKSIP